MGKKPRILSRNEYFEREPYASVLYVLHSSTDLRGEWMMLKPAEIGKRMEVVDRDSELCVRILKETGMLKDDLLRVHVSDVILEGQVIRMEKEGDRDEIDYKISDKRTLELLKEQVAERQSGLLFPLGFRMAEKRTNRISPSRLSQVLGLLHSERLVEKNSGRYSFSDKFAFDLRRDYILAWMIDCMQGEIQWKNEGWGILGVDLDDSEESQEVRSKAEDLARQTTYLRERIQNLIVRKRLKDIAEHLKKVLDSSELSEERKGYVLHYVRKEVSYPFIVKAADRLPDEEKGEEEDVKSKAEARLGIEIANFKPEWEAIMVPRLSSEELSKKVVEVAKQYDEGKAPEFEREWLEWLFFEEFPQSDFQFECSPLVVLGDFTTIP